MTVRNRPVIGQVKCHTTGCNEIATVHQVENGNRKGFLYTRCPACKCSQSTGDIFQRYLWENTDFRPGVEFIHDKRPGETQAAEPGEPEPINQDEPGEPETSEPEQPQTGYGVVGPILILSSIAAAIYGVMRA